MCTRLGIFRLSEHFDCLNRLKKSRARRTHKVRLGWADSATNSVGSYLYPVLTYYSLL